MKNLHPDHGYKEKKNHQQKKLAILAACLALTH